MKPPALDRRPRRAPTSSGILRPRRRASRRSPSATSRRCPTLRGRTVVNLFYEASTRTSSSFELAAKRLSADVVNIRRVRLLGREGRVAQGHGPDALRATTRRDRDPLPAGRRRRAGRALDHGRDRQRRRRQARAPDARRCSTSTRCAAGSARSRARSIWIVGDVLHSRVARSNILAFTQMGAQVTVAGPPTLIPREVEALGCEVRYDARRASARPTSSTRCGCSASAWTQAYVPSLREYAARYQIDGRRLRPRQLLMHPGPVNRGVELSADVIDSPQALIVEQVAAGVVVRMAVLYELLAGGGRAGARPRRVRSRRERSRCPHEPRSSARRAARPTCWSAARACSTRGGHRRAARRARARRAIARARRAGRARRRRTAARSSRARACTLFPAFVDPHVHLRTPGREHEEDLESGTRAAAAGGFCASLAMPNTDPVVDSASILRSLRERAARRGAHPGRLLGRDHERAARATS